MRDGEAKEGARRMKNELNDEGFMMFMKKPVLLMCMNYYYYGVVDDMQGGLLILSGTKKGGHPGIVYQTGKWTDASWRRLEALPAPTWAIRIATIESCGIVERS